jgi:putative redox protein
MTKPFDHTVTVMESGGRPYAQRIDAGRHVLVADEPESAGGHDAGPSPYEFLLAGLGACTAITVRMYAARKAWPLTQIAVDLRHSKIVGEGQAVIDRFERTIRLTGDLSDEQRQRLLDIAEKCPVSETLRRSALVVSQLAEPTEPA